MNLRQTENWFKIPSNSYFLVLLLKLNSSLDYSMTNSRKSSTQLWITPDIGLTVGNTRNTQRENIPIWCGFRGERMAFWWWWRCWRQSVNAVYPLEVESWGEILERLLKCRFEIIIVECIMYLELRQINMMFLKTTFFNLCIEIKEMLY